MSRLRRLTLPQRIVIVIALAGFLILVSIYVITKGFSGPGGGWFAYAPGTTAIGPDENRLGPFASWLVWLSALTVWTAAALWLLADSETGLD